MMGALIARLSYEMSRRLIAAGLVAKTLLITAATNATPIVVTTTAPHGFPSGRPVHALISGVNGNDAANGSWQLTPTGVSTFALTGYDEQGIPFNSVGSGVYTSGGTIQIAFPDGCILLGRRNVAMQMAPATPRIVFVPVGSPVWGLEPYGGVIPTIASLPRRLTDETAEQKTMKLQRQLATEQHRFEVHVTGCASPPDPDFGDFDVTQALYHTLYAVMFDLISAPRAIVLGGDWESQGVEMQSLDTRGQKWCGLVEIHQPVTDNALEFLPTSTEATLVVNFPNGSSSDDETIVTEVNP